MYTLEKLEQRANSRVAEGARCTGDILMQFDYRDEDSATIITPEELTEGLQVYITNPFSWLQTSPVQEILERTEKTVKFRTQTSVYLLTTEDTFDVDYHSTERQQSTRYIGL